MDGPSILRKMFGLPPEAEPFLIDHFGLPSVILFTISVLMGNLFQNKEDLILKGCMSLQLCAMNAWQDLKSSDEDYHWIKTSDIDLLSTLGQDNRVFMMIAII